MDMSWFGFTLLATLLLGLRMALLKMPSFKGLSKRSVTAWSFLASFILACFFFWDYLSQSNELMVTAALVWGLLFTVATLLQMYSLKSVETNTLMPFITITSLAVIVLLGVIVYGDNLSWWQYVGMGLVAMIVFFMTRDSKRANISQKLIIIAVVLVGLSVVQKFVQKTIADSVSIEAYQIYQYLFATLFAMGILLASKVQNRRVKLIESRTIAWGLLIGAISFVGGYAILLALTSGPVSIVFTVFALWVVVTAVLGALFYGEKLTRRKILLLIGAVVALITLRV